MNNSELKSCPFCGRVPIIASNNPNMIACPHCMKESDPEVGWVHIENWNNRITENIINNMKHFDFIKEGENKIINRTDKKGFAFLKIYYDEHSPNECSRECPFNDGVLCLLFKERTNVGDYEYTRCESCKRVVHKCVTSELFEKM